MAETGLTVAVTGPTGTFGFGLMPLLQQDRRIKRIVGIARRPFDPAEHGWTKMEYRQADVRAPPLGPRRARRREEGVPQGLCWRAGRARTGFRGRPRRGAPRVPDHRQRG